VTGRRRALMSWSSGKDSTMALDAIRRDEDIDVTALLVTVNSAADRIALHAVRRSCSRLRPIASTCHSTSSRSRRRARTKSTRPR